MYEDLLHTAVEGARAGGDVLRRFFRDESLAVDAKGQHDFVSQADRESETAVVAEIRQRHPDHRIVAEEGGLVAAGARGADSFEWFVDPLDGTTNFLQGLPVFCVSVGCRRGGELVAGVVLDPLRDDLFAARRGGGATWNGRPMRVSGRSGLDGGFLATGYPFRAKAALDDYLGVFRGAFLRAKSIRRCGAAALDLAHTAAGIYDGFFEFRLSAWDVAAGALLVEEAGGTVSDLDGGGRYLESGNVVAGNTAVHRDLLAIVREHASEALVDERVPRGEPAEVGA
jgi:myo-inositol-1(or 4)-monophosphatase